MYKALLVDDEPVILEGLKDTVDWSRFGIEVCALASNGLEALENIKKSRIQILITDIKMPEMSGLELISKIREMNLNIKCIVLSGYNDFEYVRRAAQMGIENYLLKPLDEKELTSTLLNTVSKIENEICRRTHEVEGINILKNNILFRWVSGDIGDDELQERTELLDMDISFGSYMVVYLKIVYNSQGRSSSIKDKNHVRLSVYNICYKIANECLGINVFHDLNGDILLLFHGNNPQEILKTADDVLNRCLANINSLLRQDIFVTAGGIVRDFRNLYMSYNQAKGLQDYCLILGSNKVLTQEELEKLDIRNRPDIRIDFDVFEKALLNKNREFALDFVEGLFKSIQNVGMLNPLQIRNMAIETMLHIVNAIKALNIDTETFTFNFTAILSEANASSSIDELKQWMCSLIDRFFESISVYHTRLHPVVRSVIEYLQTNYTGNINLKTVAAEFNINAIYLGQLFNKELGISFNTYLNQLRIEKAKQMLSSGNLNAYEVGLRLGYTNGSYFSTIFKRMTGMSPSDFK